MPPLRSRKSAARDVTRERHHLASAIETFCEPADMPCTFCFRNGKQCLMLDETKKRCQNCVRLGRSCDGVRVASSLQRLIEQKNKLDKEEEETNESLVSLQNQMVELQSQLATAVGRLQRIRKIRSKVKGKGSELMKRGLQELDAEDGILPALDGHEYWTVQDIQSMGVENPNPDWSSLGLGPDFSGVDLSLSGVDPSFLASVGQGVAGETSQQPERHSPSVP